MYNEDLKNKYLSTLSESMKEKMTRFFKRISPFEQLWCLDVCQQNNTSKLNDAMSTLFGGSPNTMELVKNMFKGYIGWCILENVEGVVKTVPEIIISPIRHIKNTMVANPLHLQTYLDKIYCPESDGGVDNIYRAYFWMAYMGIEECNFFDIKESDVDLDNMVIYYNGAAYSIYRESIKVFRNLVELKSFKLNTKTANTQRNRVSGDVIMRGARGHGTIGTVRSMVSARVTKAETDGDVDIRLNFSSLHMSGLFYRVNQMEQAGFKPNFAEEVDRIMRGKTYSKTSRRTICGRQNTIENNILSSYLMWKEAFNN